MVTLYCVVYVGEESVAFMMKKDDVIMDWKRNVVRCFVICFFIADVSCVLTE